MAELSRPSVTPSEYVTQETSFGSVTSAPYAVGGVSVVPGIIFPYEDSDVGFLDTRYKWKNNSILKGTLYATHDDWNEDVTVPGYLVDGELSVAFVKPGTKPQFVSELRSIYVPCTGTIKRTSSYLKITCSSASYPDVTYYADDFKDGVVPTKIIVLLQGAGGGGSKPWADGGFHRGKGGGSGGFVAAIVDIEAMPDLVFSVGAGGTGSDDTSSPGGNGGASSLSTGALLSSQFMLANGGGGGSSTDGQGSGGGFSCASASDGFWLLAGQVGTGYDMPAKTVNAVGALTTGYNTGVNKKEFARHVRPTGSADAYSHAESGGCSLYAAGGVGGDIYLQPVDFKDNLYGKAGSYGSGGGGGGADALELVPYKGGSGGNGVIQIFY